MAQERAALERLVLAMQAAQPLSTVADALGAFGEVTADAIKLLLAIPEMGGLVRLRPPSGAHVAVQNQHRQNLMRRAAYLVSAARRLAAVAASTRVGRSQRLRDAVKAEKRYLRAHLEATRLRVRAAERVAKAAKENPPREFTIGEPGAPINGLLGWYAVLDSRTSPECRKANGRNFDPRQIPRIGYPGTVHPACRCKPGPPHATDKRVERVRPDITDAVGGRAWGDLAVRQGRTWAVTVR